MELPYGTERIYQLVPGMEALKIAILPENGEIDFASYSDILNILRSEVFLQANLRQTS